MPIVVWIINRVDWEPREKHIRSQLGACNEEIVEQINQGLDIEFPEEAKLFPRGKWVLFWTLRADGLPDRRIPPGWICLDGKYVPNAIVYPEDGSFADVMLVADVPHVQPGSVQVGVASITPDGIEIEIACCLDVRSSVAERADRTALMLGMLRLANWMRVRLGSGDPVATVLSSLAA